MVAAILIAGWLSSYVNSLNSKWAENAFATLHLCVFALKQFS
jgi:hypothetical protein